MAEYIEREALMGVLDDAKYAVPSNDFQRGVNASVEVLTKEVKYFPTADVVPKSEYDAVVSAVDNSTKEFLKLHDEYQEAKREIENLKVLLEMKDVSYEGLEELYDIDTAALIEAREKTEAEVERLEKILNSYALQYGTAKDQQKVIDKAKAEVAREIFDDIKCSILAMSTLALFSYTDNLEESNAKQKCYKYVSELIDELDKRYTEGDS